MPEETTNEEEFQEEDLTLLSWEITYYIHYFSRATYEKPIAHVQNRQKRLKINFGCRA